MADAPLQIALPPHERPRERLRRLGTSALTDAEVLALVLGSGLPGRHVVARAADVLREVGGVAALLRMDAVQLQRLQGIGPATAGRMLAAAELWRRASEPPTGTRLGASAHIARVVLPELAHQPVERFLVVVADRALRLHEVVLLREGSDRAVQVEPREVLAAVLARGGSAFAVAHNHPGGSLEPSAADASITQALRVAADTVGLRMLDHILVAGGDWRSIG